MESDQKTSTKKTRGGVRPGAGRKKLIGAKTTTIILTEELLTKFKKLGGSKWVRTQIRLAPDEGTPPPAIDRFSSSKINLNEMLIDPQEDTQLYYAPDNSMDRTGIHQRDLILVKHGFFPRPGQIVLLQHDGKLTLRRYFTDIQPERLISESYDHSQYPTIPLPHPILGTVSYVIRHLE